MKKIIVLGLLCLWAGLGTVQAQLKIDFGVTGGAVETGYQGYFANDKNVATFTAQSYAAFGATVTIKPTWPPDAAAAALRMIDRGTDDGLDVVNLLRDWIGTDTRAVGDPMTLTISGLPAGTYQWLSYHHDAHDQTGIFSVTVNDATGSATTIGIDISNSGGTTVKNLVDVTKFTTKIVSNGNNVTLVFHQTSPSSPVATAIFVMNAFELTALATDQAGKPVPDYHATDVPRDGTILSWTPNDAATAHDVYLGTDSDDIDDGTTASAVYLGRQDANSFDPGRLELGRTYFWRVDEITTDNKVAKGNVWSFTVEPFQIPLTRVQITATASSSNSADRGPDKTIDGSGLSAEDRHSVDTTTMWLSSGIDPNAVWVQYAFDRVYQLNQMLVWNHNSQVEPAVGFGVKEAAVAYSLDGTEWTTLAPQTFTQASGKADYQANTTVDFGGVAARYVKITVINNWGGVLAQYGLSEVRFLVIPTLARLPQPASGATAIDPRLVLSWRAGREASKHQVYLSADVNEVISGTALVGTVSEPRLEAGGLLALGRTHYWRVNEVNDLEDPAVWEGEVWSFSTVAELPVDDMESYNDADGLGTRIYETWLDGWEDPANGSQVGYEEPPFAERGIVHGGAQSMPFYYDNTTAAFSEATRTFDGPQDWTQFGVKALTLWFYGDPANTAGQMYVKVNGSKVAYDGDADNLLRKPWQMWYIELSRFTGVNLKKVTELTIGVEGGTGLVLFDDIALSPSDRRLVTPAQPDAADLVAHFAFEGNTNSDAGGPAGTAVGAPVYVAGKVGQAIKLDGVRDHIVVDGSFDLPVYSVALWFQVEGGTAERDLFSAYDSAGGHGILLEVRSAGELRYLHRSPVSGTGGTNIYSRPNFGDGAWYHVALVKSADTMTLYINGVPAGSAADSTPFDKSLAKLTLGVLKHDSLSRFFPGTMDEVYLYSRALSPAEVARLAGRTNPFDEP